MTTYLIPPVTPTIWLKEHEDHLAFAPTTVLYLKNVLGELEIRVCDTCGYEDVRCLHIKNEIDHKKRLIECRLCGG